MTAEETAYCHIHGAFYSGYCECPTCAVQKSHWDMALEDIED